MGKKKKSKKSSSLAEYLLPRWWILLLLVVGWVIIPGPILAYTVNPLFELIPALILASFCVLMLGGIFVGAWRNTESGD
jgi:hypothetical protein